LPQFLPSYDELWVVSDLHMGGSKTGANDFQIFHRGPRLAALIRHVGSQRPGDQVALVLNGDIIDSLAETDLGGYVALDRDAAERLVKRIWDDPSFADVWNALAEFVGTANRHLVFVVGNHDIELALGVVESAIRRRLGGDDPAVDARIVFATHGGGFGCRVGNARVFCTHGNEVDAWNNVDYTELGSLDNAINAGRPGDASRWKPNAGTRLVIDAMNKVKARYPFVDLLKPEYEPVLAVILTLDAKLALDVASKIGTVAGIVKEYAQGKERVSNLLSAYGGNAEAVPPLLMAQTVVAEAVGPRLRAQLEGEKTEDAMLVAAERAMAAETPTRPTPTPGTLGFWDVAKGMIGLDDEIDSLRKALLDWIEKDDETFDIAAKDETFERITARVGPEVDYVITGHTHLARSIPFGGGRHYFNCGTWIRLLRLTPESLRSREVFKRVYDALAAKSMQALDEAKIPGPGGKDVELVLDRTNAVQITSDGTAATGVLFRVGDGAALTRES
jgi:UDP-2,3-diacylglucosamine pyrophosphatase LpxH